MYCPRPRPDDVGASAFLLAEYARWWLSRRSLPSPPLPPPSLCCSLISAEAPTFVLPVWPSP
eukprot:363362-Chlamydomonas_euryale.AAC.19